MNLFLCVQPVWSPLPIGSWLEYLIPVCATDGIAYIFLLLFLFALPFPFVCVIVVFVFPAPLIPGPESVPCQLFQSFCLLPARENVLFYVQHVSWPPQLFTDLCLSQHIDTPADSCAFVLFVLWVLGFLS